MLICPNHYVVKDQQISQNSSFHELLIALRAADISSNSSQVLLFEANMQTCGNDTENLSKRSSNVDGVVIQISSLSAYRRDNCTLRLDALPSSRLKRSDL